MVHPCTSAHSCQTIRCLHGHLLSSEHIAKALQFRLVGCPSKFDSSLGAINRQPNSLYFYRPMSPMQAWSMHPLFRTFQSACLTLEIRSRSPNIIKSSPSPNNVSMQD